jgi:thymidylate kinase
MVFDVRATLVGIDGSGKTTVVRRMREFDDVAVVHAVRAHDDPQSPYAALSTALALASAAADAIGRPQLKVCVLYLQLCLYGLAERRCADGRRRVLLSDRHPLIDPLVYLPLYAGLKTDDGPDGDVERWWGLQNHDSAGAVRDWLEVCSGDTNAWALGAELIGLATMPPAHLLGELCRMFDTQLPDKIVLLDLPVPEALNRARARPRGTELHETMAALYAVRQRYDIVLDWLTLARPQVTVHRIDCRGRTVEQVAEGVRATVGLGDTEATSVTAGCGVPQEGSPARPQWRGGEQ